MTTRVDSIVDLVGDTPLVRLRTLEQGLSGVELYGKCEFRNPGGSVKDRAALQMMRDAIADGRLTRDKILIDSTSGNTGVAYALLGAALGYKVALVMPENVSRPRKQIVRAFGTEVIFSSPMEGSDGAIRMVRRIVAESPSRYFYPDQYSNESNPRAHYLGTAPELWRQTSGRITHFVAGIGTSGTIMGTGRRLHEYSPTIEVIAVEPEDALHGLEGLKHMKSSIVPAIWRPEEAVDRILPLATEEGWDMSERLRRESGLYVGHSAGAAVAAALRVARECHVKGRGAVIVALLPDSATRYLELERKPVSAAPRGGRGDSSPLWIDIPRTLLLAVYAHARRTYPEECCGFLIGPRAHGELDQVREVENRQNELHRTDPEQFPRDARTAYNMAPQDILFLDRSLGGDRPVRVIYHSHCDAGAYFSAEDKRMATWAGQPLYPVDYLVVDVRAEGVQGARLFRFDPVTADFALVAEYKGQ